jgi:SAM-dependent methyltransferase
VEDSILGRVRMRKHIRDFVAICARMLPIEEPIYEFGSLIVKGQRPRDVDLRPIFGGRKFYGTDFRDGPGVDQLLDLHNIDLPNDSVGTAISVETFEHVKYPWKAITELYRVLKPSGLVILTSLMHFPIHNHPDDYWRYTPSGFRVLLEEFDDAWVDWSGDSAFPHTVFGIGIKSAHLPDMEQFVKTLEGKRIIWRREPGTACKI